MDLLLKDTGREQILIMSLFYTNMLLRRKLLILVLILSFFAPAAAPEAKAMDPVTLAVLAPIALKAAQIAMPYLLRGIQCTGSQFLKMGLDVADILRLPVGLFQITFGAPLGMFDKGLQNICMGGIAPLKLVWDTITLPIAMTGINPP